MTKHFFISIFILVLWVGFSCSHNRNLVTDNSYQNKDKKNQYELIVDSVDLKLSGVKGKRLASGKINIYFENGFSDTPVKLRCGKEKIIAGKLITNDKTGLASVIQLPGDDNKDVKITLNTDEYKLKLKENYSCIHISKCKEKLYVVYTNQKYTYY